MSAENSKMLVFLCFFPNSSNLSTISMVAQEKNRKILVFMLYVCMYVRPKLTFVSLFFCFFNAPSPLIGPSYKKKVKKRCPLY